jgi:glutamyl/glutaminyl-tRNA synthetase
MLGVFDVGAVACWHTATMPDNWLFARRTGGVFVLRLEDTDRARTVSGAAARLQEVLDWVGLTPDEGPLRLQPPAGGLRGAGAGSVAGLAGGGGAHGPYVQSERLSLYRAAAERLLASGAAYRCFCAPPHSSGKPPPPPSSSSSSSPQPSLRRAGLGDNPGGSSHRSTAAAGALVAEGSGCCAALPAATVATRLERGDPHVVRLLVPRGGGGGGAAGGSAAAAGGIVVQDALRGEVGFELQGVDDAVLLKSDGWPSYHLASVVDDAAMGISHVIRGEEWLPSAPKHAMLYDALGWPRPTSADDS